MEVNFHTTAPALLVHIAIQNKILVVEPDADIVKKLIVHPDGRIDQSA